MSVYCAVWLNEKTTFVSIDVESALVRLAVWALIIGAGLCLWYRRAAVVECQRSVD